MVKTRLKAANTTVPIAAIPIIFICAAVLSSEPQGLHWPSFRGSGASGVAENFPTPTSWNVENSVNVMWKSPIDGLGHSSPVVWDQRIFITTAISGKKDTPLKVGLYGDIEPVDDESAHEWHLHCLDKNTDEILWERTVVCQRLKGIPNRLTPTVHR